MLLETLLNQLSEKIEKLRRQSIGEQNTKSILIEPMLKTLGWDIEDFDEVRREYRPMSADNPVDYVLLSKKSPKLYVEAKGLGEKLSDRKWSNQIMGYAAMAGVEWVILTDGNEYKIFNAHAAMPIDEKLFRETRVTGDSQLAIDTFQLLTKVNVENRYIDESWKLFVANRKLRRTLERLVGENPEPSFVALLRQLAPDITSEDIRSQLLNVRFQFEEWAPSMHKGPDHSTATNPTGPSSAPSESGKADNGGTPWRHISLNDLIENRMISVPFSIIREYKGLQLSGQVLGGQKIRVHDLEFESLSTAAGFARAYALGTQLSGKYPATNGWDFWRFREEDGRTRALDILRQRLYDANSK